MYSLICVEAIGVQFRVGWASARTSAFGSGVRGLGWPSGHLHHHIVVDDVYKQVLDQINSWWNCNQ